MLATLDLHEINTNFLELVFIEIWNNRKKFFFVFGCLFLSMVFVGSANSNNISPVVNNKFLFYQSWSVVFHLLYS